MDLHGLAAIFRKNHHDWVLVFSAETSRAGDAFGLISEYKPKFAPDSLGKEVDPKNQKYSSVSFVVVSSLPRLRSAVEV